MGGTAAMPKIGVHADGIECDLMSCHGANMSLKSRPERLRPRVYSGPSLVMSSAVLALLLISTWGGSWVLKAIIGAVIATNAMLYAAQRYRGR